MVWGEVEPVIGGVVQVAVVLGSDMGVVVDPGGALVPSTHSETANGKSQPPKLGLKYSPTGHSYTK